MVHVIINSEWGPVVVKQYSNRVTTKESHPGAHVSKSACSIGNTIRAPSALRRDGWMGASKPPHSLVKNKKAFPFHLASLAIIFYSSFKYKLKTEIDIL